MSLGFTYHLMFDLQKALQYYHKAEFLNNDDGLIRSLVNKAIADINNMALCPIDQTYLAPPPTSSAAHHVSPSSSAAAANQVLGNRP